MARWYSKQGLIAAALIVLLAGLNLYQYFTRPSPGDPQPLPNAELFDRFHEHFYYHTEGWQISRWLGVDTWQNPNDVWLHQEIICEVKPDLIVECGTHRGGSACIWALVLQQVNPQGRVVTIDIVDLTEQARELPIWKERVDFLHGSSTDPRIVDEVTKRAKGKKVMVILDSDHKKPHVLGELNAYAPLVNVGSYLIVQDTNINGHPVYKDYGPGPWEAVEEFLSDNREFVSDVRRDRRFLFTMHPRGYLKRVQ